ncbi:MAG: hypothetical protein M0Q99_07455, partial [Candidatus Cloacimonetes bacterium]|nr:hypothetical protein [Candidatus Cloacimonadota bacterium]
MKLLPIVMLLCIMQIPLMIRALEATDSFAVLSENELLELQTMLSTEDLLPQHTSFYRDWDPYSRLKSDWHMQI